MSHEPYFDVATASICFVVKVAGRFVTCHVTEGWMYDKLGPMRLRWGLLDAYRRHARVIDAAAAQRWEASGGVEPVWLAKSGSLPPSRPPIAGAAAKVTSGGTKQPSSASHI